jgi:hypothetical protein
MNDMWHSGNSLREPQMGREFVLILIQVLKVMKAERKNKWAIFTWQESLPPPL